MLDDKAEFKSRFARIFRQWPTSQVVVSHRQKLKEGDYIPIELVNHTDHIHCRLN